MRFKSTLFKDIAYAVGENDSRCDASGAILYRAVFYSTYGDGLVQHSPIYPAAVDRWIDFMVSIYTHLIAHPEDLPALDSAWPSPRVTSAQIAFVAGLKYSEDKKRYYSFSELRTSASPWKQHDRRWQEIPSCADGTFSGVYSILMPNIHPLGLAERFALHETVTGWFGENDKGYPRLDGYGIGSQDNFWDVSAAYRMVDALVKAHRETQTAVRIFGSLSSGYIRKQLNPDSQERAI